MARFSHFRLFGFETLRMVRSGWLTVVAAVGALANAWSGWAYACTPKLWSVIDAKRGDHGVSAELVIDAPVAVVWEVLTDCATAPRHVPGMVSCKVLRVGPAGQWDEREHRMRLPWFPLILRNVVRSDYVPQQSLSYHRLGQEAGGLRGQWRLTPDASGKATQITYTGYMSGLLPVPDVMAKAYVLRGLEALQAECVRRGKLGDAGAPNAATNTQP
jgi:uncharacterized protein YndB with AHSA1/START domain